MKKILVFTSTFPKFIQGDATPPFVYELSKNLAEKGLNITILTPRVPGSKTYEVRDGMKIYRYPYFFISSWEKLNDGAILPNIKKNKRLLFQIPFLLISGFVALIKIVKKEKIEVIHAHWLVPQGLLACIYKKIWNRKIRILCTSHGSDIHSLGGKIMNSLKKFVLDTSDHITVVSNYLKNEVRKLGVTKPIEVISMGVDVDKFNPRFYDESIKKGNNIKGKFLLYVGRLAPEKGIRYLLDAMPEVIKEYPDIKLMLVGGGPLETELKEQAMKLKIEDNLIRKGWVDHANLPPYFATADIFILPSLKEGMPVILVEALSSGIICLVSDIQQNIDVIGHNGYTFEVKNIIQLEQKIVYCINNSSKYKNNEIIDKRFSRESVSTKYYHLFFI